MIERLFLDHPRSVNETYGEHFIAASGFGLAMIAAGMACLLHGLLPRLFVTTGSDAIRRLHNRVIENRIRKDHIRKDKEQR
ncbi:DUF6356 family protein [Croceicoccus mobilis]|uniref:Type 1 capsular polysaccharide biosynthesis protein J n=1 Tax=Croceicoccus mobilis TaxID=1703339 RepID=A0A916Z9E6_9SPHN|nr:DUF6356 family protein [Croceicoccus mobilis]GGD80999.1 type 1 capsular polysaccharide biosynthesis protein J [Croceicoccus mobilis]